jgi:hypothetical protein
MRTLMAIALGITLFGGCNQSPDAKQKNDAAATEANKAGQELKEAAEAVGNAAVKGTEALGQEIKDAAGELKKDVHEATKD